MFSWNTMTIFAAILLALPPTEVPQGQRNFYKLFSIDKDGKSLVVFHTEEDGTMQPSPPGLILQINDKTLVKLRSPVGGVNPEITPKQLYELYIQGREISFIAVWTDSQPETRSPLKPDYLLVIMGKSAQNPKN